ncbi:hypothetical protein TNCV_912241 [Trichonephila clavipes]|nr:hypothetical protein TNCV_912241 [Trichonephila clavipes]
MTQSGHGSLVVKITDSWLACHEFEPSITEDPPCSGAMHVGVDVVTAPPWQVKEVDEYLEITGLQRGGEDVTSEDGINSLQMEMWSKETRFPLE